MISELALMLLSPVGHRTRCPSLKGHSPTHMLHQTGTDARCLGI